MQRHITCLLAAALSTALVAGCVSTTYETASVDKGAQGPSIVRLDANGGLHAFGRKYSTAKELARELERHGASFRNRKGPRRQSRPARFRKDPSSPAKRRSDTGSRSCRAETSARFSERGTMHPFISDLCLLEPV